MCGSKCCNHENISLKHEEPDRFDRSQVLFLKEFIFFIIDRRGQIYIFFFLREIKIIF